MSADAYHLLHALRSKGTVTDMARRALAAAPYRDGVDAHAAQRADVVDALLRTLVPDDHDLAVWLLAQEVAAHHAVGYGASPTLRALVAAVARFGRPRDALLLWRAWSATLDTRDAIDVEQVGRGGVERVRAWLLRQITGDGPDAADARAALDWLERGVADGAFEDLAAYFAWSDEVNGLATSAPT